MPTVSGSCLLDDVRLIMGPHSAEWPVRFTDSGSYFLAPKGIWHSARPQALNVVLFATLGAGTVNVARPEGAPL